MLVVKVGGSQGIDYDKVADDLAQIASDTKVVLIHGGSALTNQVAEQLGHPPEFVTSPGGSTWRRTDRRTLEIFEMVYCGAQNKGIVERLQSRGVNAVGLSGLDGRIWEGKRKDGLRIVRNGKVMVLRDDYTGRVEKVNAGLLRSLMEGGFLPVLTPPAVSCQGEAINVDGDRAAAATAAALGAKTLLLLSNVPGLLSRYPDEDSLIRSIPARRVEEFMEVAQGRMKVKVLGAQEALQAGVERVILGDARIEAPITRALAGGGTVIGG